MQPASQPLITVIVPVLNERRHIERCLESITNQQYPRDRYEVLVVDGGSTDGTREIIEGYERRGLVRLLHNPRRRPAAGMNVGLRNAAGDVMVRLDGHAFAAPDFLPRLVDGLRTTGADCVGGPITSIGETYMGRAIAMAMSSRFGVGGASFRVGGVGPADTVAFGAYKRETFETIGGFAEHLDKGEDCDVNYRLLDRGGKIMLVPDVHVSYVVRSDLPSFIGQYFSYGRSKPAVIVRHPEQTRPRHLVPAAFVGALALSVILAFTISPWPLVGLAALYGAFIAAATVYLASRHRTWEALPLPAILAGMHVAYGLGFFVGAAEVPFKRPWRYPMPALDGEFGWNRPAAGDAQPALVHADGRPDAIVSKTRSAGE